MQLETSSSNVCIPVMTPKPVTQTASVQGRNRPDRLTDETQSLMPSKGLQGTSNLPMRDRLPKCPRHSWQLLKGLRITKCNVTWCKYMHYTLYDPSYFIAT